MLLSIKLTVGGKMVLPVGGREEQELKLVERRKRKPKIKDSSPLPVRTVDWSRGLAELGLLLQVSSLC